jgi:hypothetical protein
MQAVLPRQSRATSHLYTVCNALSVLPRRIGNEHWSLQIMGGPFGLLLNKMRVIRPLHNSPLELAAINL